MCIAKTSLFSLLVLTLLASCDVPVENRKPDTSPALLAQVQALQAESDIRRKLQEYMALLSASDWDNYIDYFTEDSRLIMAEGTVAGRQAIKERMANASARMASARGDAARPKRADLLSNILVDVHGDSASAESRFTFIEQNSEGSFTVVGSGRYLDEWRLDSDGEWRIAAREVDYDLLRTAPQP